jgi:plastocyanin
MRALWLPVAAIAGFAAAVVPAIGANQTVTATTPYSFTPHDVAVMPGQTVTWNNQGGGMHSVVFDDPNVKPFTGGTQNSNGLPSTANWTAEGTFPNVGTFGYHCGYHGNAMTGTVYVNDAGTVPTGTTTGTTGTTTPPGGTTPTGTTPTNPTGTTPGPGGDAGGPSLTSVAPIRDHFCTKKGPTCRKPGVTVVFRLDAAADLAGTVERRPRSFHRRLARGAAVKFRSFGAVRFHGRAGTNRFTFVRTSAGRRLTPADYRVTFTARDPAGERSAARVVRFFVRPS